MYRSYYDILSQFVRVPVKVEDSDKEQISEGVLNKALNYLREAIEDLDLDKMDEVMEVLDQYSYPESLKEVYEALVEAASQMDVDTCMELMEQFKL